MDNIQQYIESLIFAASKSMTAKDIKGTLNSYLDKTIKEKEILAALEALVVKYNDEKYPFEIVSLAGGYQFMTKGTYYPLVSQFLKLESKKKLSKAALETLAVVSYKQPITKSVIESIRGVNCDYSIQKLLEKELLEIGGRAEGPGRPLLYITSDKFMDHFGLKDLNDLPKIKEFEMPGEEIGLTSTDNQPVPNQEGDETEQAETADLGRTGKGERIASDSSTKEVEAPKAIESEPIAEEVVPVIDTVISAEEE